MSFGVLRQETFHFVCAGLIHYSLVLFLLKLIVNFQEILLNFLLKNESYTKLVSILLGKSLCDRQVC